MHRFYLPPKQCGEAALRLDGREAHHALHVLRVKRGDAVSVLDGAGREFVCEITGRSQSSLDLQVTKTISVPPPPCSITLLQAVPKGRIIEDIIQKAVELGARRVVPLLTRRVVIRLDDREAIAKGQKWQQVAIEAVKQCGATWLPQIEPPATIDNFLQRKETFDLALVGSLQPDRHHPRECIQAFQAQHRRQPRSAGVWIGPEGDFTIEELKLIQAAGAHPVSLGRLVLRVETAAIYCLSVLNYELNPAE
ncbi:MAG TPA: RsmE family RNA methyltransferase [Candidatus Acidoferrum sp.]|nr:RsmE family RNA methyltransferase [Candidatus Acidoferrum sp.]